jgi:hypothetical protein
LLGQHRGLHLQSGFHFFALLPPGVVISRCTIVVAYYGVSHCLPLGLLGLGHWGHFHGGRLGLGLFLVLFEGLDLLVVVLYALLGVFLVVLLLNFLETIDKDFGIDTWRETDLFAGVSLVEEVCAPEHEAEERVEESLEPASFLAD